MRVSNIFSTYVDRTRYDWELQAETGLYCSVDGATGLRRFLATGGRYDEVVPGLFVGPAPLSYPEIARFARAILDLRDPDSGNLRKAQLEARGANLDYVNLGFKDGAEPPDGVVDEALRWLAERLGRGVSCLVHCAAGVSRSPFVVCAYLLPTFGWDLESAARHLSRRHRDSYPAAVYLQRLERMAEERRLPLTELSPPS